MEKVASIIKYKGEFDRERVIHWMLRLPQKYSNYELNTLLNDVHKGQYFLWTEESDIRIL